MATKWQRFDGNISASALVVKIELCLIHLSSRGVLIIHSIFSIFDEIMLPSIPKSYIQYKHIYIYVYIYISLHSFPF